MTDHLLGTPAICHLGQIDIRQAYKSRELCRHVLQVIRWDNAERVFRQVSKN